MILIGGVVLAANEETLLFKTPVYLQTSTRPAAVFSEEHSWIAAPGTIIYMHKGAECRQPFHRNDNTDTNFGIAEVRK